MRVRAGWHRFYLNNVIRYRYYQSTYLFLDAVYRINEVSRQPEIHRAEQIFFQWLISSSGPVLPHYRGFTMALRLTTLGRSPLDEWSARRRGLYLITHNMHEGQTSKLTVEFEPATPQTHASDSVGTGSCRTVVTRTFVLKLLCDCYKVTSYYLLMKFQEYCSKQETNLSLILFMGSKKKQLPQW
jgi:hypothetical protein